jgi:RHS repeat-associated protein
VEESIANPFRFTGQWLDSGINEYYLRARMYEPHIGRFTSRDPITGKFEEPLTLQATCR